MKKGNKCRSCGKLVDKEITHCPHCGQRICKPKWKKWLIVGIILLIVAAVCWFLLFNKKEYRENLSTSLSEEQLWKKIEEFRDTNQPDSLEWAIKVYQHNYEDGENQFRVKQLKSRLEEEKKAWKIAENKGFSQEAVETFVNEYDKEGIFKIKAKEKLDSIRFNEAQKLNTREAYDAYLNDYPEGKYKKEAIANLDRLDAETTTTNENQNVQDVVKKHFLALQNNDVDALNATVAKDLSSYMGKLSCTDNDVREYVKHMHEVSQRGVKFELTNFQFKKFRPSDDSDPVYQVDFSLAENMDKPSKTTLNKNKHRFFKGKASVNFELKITSLYLEEILNVNNDDE